MTWIFPSLLDVPHKHFLKFKHEIVQMWEGRKPSKSRALPSLPQRAHEKVAQVSPLDRIGKNENELSELHPHLHQARAASEKELRGLRKFIVSGAPSRLFKTAPRRLALPSSPFRFASGAIGALCLFLIVPQKTFAEGGPKQFPIYDFSKGVDSYHSSISLPDGYVQASNNVLFDSVAPVTKRQGYTVSFSTKNYSYQQLWTYVDQSNTSWIIARASDSIIASNLTGTIVKIATVSINSPIGETNAFGSAYFVDQAQGVYSWNGTATTYVPGSPNGSIITQFHNRLWVTGAVTPNGNQVYGSGFFSGTTWTIGPNPTDPVQLSFGLQDNFDNVTALYVYLDTLYVFKHYAIYALYGFDQTSFQSSQITQECGCIDGNSIQTFAGAMRFVSLRGVENFDGYTCTRISDPIKNMIDPAVQSGGFSSQSWLQDTASDWNAGTIVNLDSTTVPGQLTVNGYSDTFGNPALYSTIQGSWNISSNIATPTSCSSGLNPISCEAVLVNPVAINTPLNSLRVSSVVNFPAPSGHMESCSGLINASNDGYRVCLSSIDSGFWQMNISRAKGGGVDCTNFSFGTPDTAAHNIELDRDNISGAMSGYFDGVLEVSCSDSLVPGNFSFPYLSGSPNNSAQYGSFSKISVVIGSSGTFKSQIHGVGSINSWGNFGTSDFSGGGALTFSICSSTNSNMGAPTSCSSQLENSQISIATGTFVQWYATFTVTTASQTPTLDNVRVNWFSGNRAVPMASTIWDNRYWLSLTTNTFDTANDAVVVQNKDGVWSSFDIHAGGFTQSKGSLYHSDSRASGNVYLDNQGYSDNGTPINAYLWTKDYPFVNLAQDGVLQAIYPTFSNLANTNISLSYDVDDVPNFYTLSSVNQNEYSTAASIKIPLGDAEGNNQVFGKTFAFLVSQNDSNPMQFYGLRALFSEREIP